MQAKVEEKINSLRDAVGTESTEGMKRAMEALQQEAMKMGESMYKQGGASGGGGSPGGGPGGDAGKSGATAAAGDADDVIDAEFKPTDGK